MLCEWRLANVMTYEFPPIFSFFDSSDSCVRNKKSLIDVHFLFKHLYGPRGVQTSDPKPVPSAATLVCYCLHRPSRVQVECGRQRDAAVHETRAWLVFRKLGSITLTRHYTLNCVRFPNKNINSKRYFTRQQYAVVCNETRARPSRKTTTTTTVFRVGVIQRDSRRPFRARLPICGHLSSLGPQIESCL